MGCKILNNRMGDKACARVGVLPIGRQGRSAVVSRRSIVEKRRGSQSPKQTVSGCLDPEGVTWRTQKLETMKESDAEFTSYTAYLEERREIQRWLKDHRQFQCPPCIE